MKVRARQQYNAVVLSPESVDLVVTEADATNCDEAGRVVSVTIAAAKSTEIVEMGQVVVTPLDLTTGRPLMHQREVFTRVEFDRRFAVEEK